MRRRPKPAPITPADFQRACGDPFRVHALLERFLEEHRHQRTVELRTLQTERARLEKLRMAKAGLKPENRREC